MTHLYFQVANVKLTCLQDKEFLKAFDVAKHLTGMDGWRLSQLWNLVGQSAKLPSGELLEVGTARGGSGYVIAASAHHHSIKDRFTLCDTYEGLVKSSEKDMQKNGSMKAEVTPAEIANIMLPFSNIQVLKGVFPNDCWYSVEGCEFRFVHIDVDIYQSAKDIFEWVFPNLVQGGIIVFDDFEVNDTPGISELVYELWSLPRTIWFRTGMFQAIMVKV